MIQLDDHNLKSQDLVMNGTVKRQVVESVVSKIFAEQNSIHDNWYFKLWERNAELIGYQTPLILYKGKIHGTVDDLANMDYRKRKSEVHADMEAEFEEFHQTIIQADLDKKRVDNYIRTGVGLCYNLYDVAAIFPHTIKPYFQDIFDVYLQDNLDCVSLPKAKIEQFQTRFKTGEQCIMKLNLIKKMLGAKYGKVPS